jgi:hypothetical protein
MATIVLRSQKGEPLTFSEVDSNFTELNDDLADRYTKAEADARYVQGTTQTENTFTATAGQTAFTLSEAAASSSSIMVTVDGVVQPTSAYSLSMDGLTLTLAEAPGNGASVRVLILGVAGSTNAPGDDTVTTVKLRDGAVTAAKLDDGAVTTAKLAFDGGPLSGMRNAIINGNFDIWQRGTSAVGSGFRADRFNAYLTTGSSFLQERYELTDSQRDAIGYGARYAWAGAIFDTTSSIQLVQPIEGVNSFAGQQVTVSFWAFVSTGTCTISGNLFQYFGTGGSPSSTVFNSLALSTATVTTTLTKITATITLPSISGKTLGSNGDDYLGFLLDRPAGVASFLFIAQVQVEAGPVATPFERRPIGTELALCQRYFEIFSANNRYYATVGGEVSNVPLFWTPKRATPTLAQFAAGSAFNLSSTSFTASDSVSGRMENVTAGTGDSLVHNVKISASAEL